MPKKDKLSFTLVLLHGWGMNSGVWDTLVDSLKDLIDCVCIDLPGYGNSANVAIEPQDYDLECLANWVSERLPENSILLGWSLGGLVAQKIAIQQASDLNSSPTSNNKVKGLICIASTPKFEETPSWPGIKPKVLAMFHAQLSHDHTKTLSRFLAIQMQGIADVDLRKSVIRDLAQRLLSRPSPNPKLLDRGLDILGDADMRDDLHKIDVPTLRLYGRLDSLVPQTAVQKITQLHPQSHTIIYSNASHAPFITDNQKISEDISQFVTTCQFSNK